MSQPDIIVVGGGHNTLGAAAYLQRCGLSTLVLEKNAVPGGGVISKPLTLPGFTHDCHATGVVHLQGHPILTGDELELLSRFGLEFRFPEISYMTVFPDGERLCCYADREQAIEDIARFSHKDAVAYRRLVAMMDTIMPLIGMSMARPPVPFSGFMGMLGQMPGGNELISLMLKSAHDIITENFENDRVRTHFAKWVYEGLNVDPEHKTTGIAMLYLIGLSHTHPPGVPVGGMGSLSQAMIRCIEHYGGEIRLNTEVRRVINRNGVAKAVELASGEVLEARRAVIAAIPPHYLEGMVDGLDPEITGPAKNFQHSEVGGVLINCALREAPRWTGIEETNRCLYVNVVTADSYDGFRKDVQTLRYGGLNETPFLCVSNHTNFDPTRAPEGMHTLYAFSLAPYNLTEGAEHWDRIKEERTRAILDRVAQFAPNVSGDNILAMHVDTPLEMSRHTPSFRHSDFNGGAMYLYQMMGMRPTPALSQYRVPGAQGLYLCGPFMHPGGGVTGGGRPVAMRVMEDLEVDYSKVIRS